MDKKLLTIKIIERSRSLRNKVIILISQMANGMKEMLSYAHSGIKEWQKIEVQEKYRQLQLNI